MEGCCFELRRAVLIMKISETGVVITYQYLVAQVIILSEISLIYWLEKLTPTFFGANALRMKCWLLQYNFAPLFPIYCVITIEIIYPWKTKNFDFWARVDVQSMVPGVVIGLLIFWKRKMNRVLSYGSKKWSEKSAFLAQVNGKQVNYFCEVR